MLDVREAVKDSLEMALFEHGIIKSGLKLTHQSRQRPSHPSRSVEKVSIPVSKRLLKH